jgi:hypothetical protein
MNETPHRTGQFGGEESRPSRPIARPGWNAAAISRHRPGDTNRTRGCLRCVPRCDTAVFALRRRAARGLRSSRGNPIARYSRSPGPASRITSKGTNWRALRLSSRASRIGTRRRGRCARGGADSDTFPQQHVYPAVSGNKAGFSLASRGVWPAPGRPGRHLHSMAAPRPRRASDWSKRERDAT